MYLPTGTYYVDCGVQCGCCTYKKSHKIFWIVLGNLRLSNCLQTVCQIGFVILYVGIVALKSVDSNILYSFQLWNLFES